MRKWVYQVWRNPLRLVHLVRYMGLKQTVRLPVCGRCRQDSGSTDVLSPVMCFVGKHADTMAKGRDERHSRVYRGAPECAAAQPGCCTPPLYGNPHFRLPSVVKTSRPIVPRIAPAAAAGEHFVPYSRSGVLKCCGRRPLLGLVQSGSLRFQSSTIVSPDGQP